MKRIEYEQRRHDAIARHTGDQYGYYGEMMDIDYDYIAALETRIAELEMILAADKLVEDGWIGRIEAGDKHIAEMEAENSAMRKNAIVWHKYPASSGEIHPVYNRKYLVVSDGCVDYVKYVNSWLGDHFQGVPSDVTHWAELPAPPEEKP